MRRNDRSNFDRNNYGGSISRNVNPWGNDMGGGRSGGMMNQGGGPLNADALSLANSLINNLLRGQGGQVPSLLDLPSSDIRGGGYGYRDFDDFDRYDERMGRSIGNRNSGSNRNRRQGGGSRSKGGVRKPNSKDRAKNVLAKNSKNADASADNANSTESDGKDNGKNGEKSRKNKRRDSPYANIPNDLFYCHMCMKHMWDSNSFENHIKGRSHQMMKEGIEESYRLRANMIRQEAKIMEQLKGIEIDRMKRMGKNLKASNQHRDYCTMCDLQFYGNLSAHRKTEGHLNLKKFLHPRCSDCSIEYSNRTDFDDHLLSPEHMKKISKKASRFMDKNKKNQLNILTEADELQGLKPEKEEKKEKKQPAAEGETTEGMETENGGEGETVEEDGENKEKTDDAEKVPVIEEPEDVILDFVDGNVIPIEVENKIPKYNHLRPLAASMIAKLECYECRLCGRYFDTETTSEIHSRTIYHYRQFVKFLNEKSSETKIAQRRAEAAAEEEERRKRQKLEDEEAEQNGGEKMDEGAELYDPSEATGDDEEKMNVDANGEGAEKSEESEAPETNGAKAEEESATTENGEDSVKEEKADESGTETTPTKQEPATPRQQPARNLNNRTGNNRNQNTPRSGGNQRGRGRYNRY